MNEEGEKKKRIKGGGAKKIKKSPSSFSFSVSLPLSLPSLSGS